MRVRFSVPIALTVALVAGLSFAAGPFAAAAGGESPAFSARLDALNRVLASSAARHLRIDKAEIFVEASGWTGASQTVVANNRQHRLTSQFVEGDPRRGGFFDISYLVDQSDGTAASRHPVTLVPFTLTNADTEPAIDRAMQRWEDQPRCPGPALIKVPDPGTDPDLIDGLILENPALIGTPFADITHAGWLPREFFDLLAPNGSASILGVTFTLVFVDEHDNPTDIDRNGAADVGLREIYYNGRFFWTNDPTNNRAVHIESVVTHEAGHAMGLGHFGKIFFNGDGPLKFAPRAVMNAAYVSPYSDITGTDNGSFCSIWANRR